MSMKNIFFFIVFFSLLFCLQACHNTRVGKGTDSEGATAPEVKSIIINGDSIHYVDVGNGDPVIFIHGAVGDYRTHTAQMDTFSNNHRVISYSRRFAYPNNVDSILSSCATSPCRNSIPRRTSPGTMLNAPGKISMRP